MLLRKMVTRDFTGLCLAVALRTVSALASLRLSGNLFMTWLVLKHVLLNEVHHTCIRCSN